MRSFSSLLIASLQADWRTRASQAGLSPSQLAERADSKVVFVGDAKQLAAVEAGKPFELTQANGIATARMTEIKRQRTDGLKAAVATLLPSAMSGAIERRHGGDQGREGAHRAHRARHRG